VTALETKLTQLRLERNHAEAIRLLQALLAQGPSAFEREIEDPGNGDMGKSTYLLYLAFAQRFVGDMAGAKATAEQARNTLEPLPKEPLDAGLEMLFAVADAVLGERDSALREAERSIMTPDPITKTTEDPGNQELLALIQTVLGENSRAISTLTRLLKTSYADIWGPVPVTPALLRLDPLWDPLRADPAFQKLCQEKKP